MSLLYSFANINEPTLECEGEAGWALWEEVGSRGLDTWVELPARYTEPDGPGGEPSGSYDYSSSVGDYLATFESEKSQVGCYTWLRYALGYSRVKEED